MTPLGDIALNATLCPGNCTSSEQGLCSALVNGPLAPWCECNMGWTGHDCSVDCLPMVITFYSSLIVAHAAVGTFASIKLHRVVQSKDKGKPVKLQIVGWVLAGTVVREIYYVVCKGGLGGRSSHF
jgi:hypothetical protein